MKIYLARHGEAAYGLEGERGEFPGVPLTDNGRKQAEALAEKLKEIKFDYVFCSDMQRTKETIKPLEKYLSEIKYEPRIREISGKASGRPTENLYPEPVEEQINRVESFIEELVKLEADKILIVCHFGIIRYLTGKFGTMVERPECGEFYIVDI